MIQIGVDDAGRGVVLGPLVIGGALVGEESAQRLAALGIKDSKMYKDAKTVVNRFMEIGSLVDKFSVRLLPAVELNENNKNGISIDRSAIPYIVDIVVELGKGVENPKVIIDNLQHKEDLIALLRQKGFENVSVEAGAEQNLAVAAASVVASAQFELELRKLRLEWGDLGSGNPNDPKTIKWLTEYFKKKRAWPSFVRTYYKTIKRMESEIR